MGAGTSVKTAGPSAPPPGSASAASERVEGSRRGRGDETRGRRGIPDPLRPLSFPPRPLRETVLPLAQEELDHVVVLRARGTQVGREDALRGAEDQVVVHLRPLDRRQRAL